MREKLPGDPAYPLGTTTGQVEGEPRQEPLEPDGTGYDPVADEDRARRRRATYAHWVELWKEGK